MDTSEPAEVATVTSGDPIEKEDTEKATATESGPKRARHRKKQLFERILKQMEFYFSDANLTKDRFLGELTRTDPAVPLDIFLKFNKIRAITQNVREIAKALRSSKLLECIDDETKVRRISELQPYDAESRTVYVESIPAMVGRDWLEGVFAEYGPVAYISLPKFKNSNRIKGFAFIEYDKPEDAQKCLTAFGKMGCKLPTNINPEQLTTIKTFAAEHSQDKTDKTDDVVDKQNNTIDTDAVKDEKIDREDELPRRDKKDNKESVDVKTKEDKKRPKEGNEDGPPNKKQKKNRKKKNKENSSNNTNVDNKASSKESQEPDTEMNTSEIKSEEVEQPSEVAETTEQNPKKKCRKRTAKERNKAKNKASKSGLPPSAPLGLQVLSKTEWRVLRNKYLNLQRKQMAELKNSLRARGLYQPLVANGSEESHGHAREEKIDSSLAKLHKPEGVFVRVELPAPCVDVRQTKREVRSNVHVQHVDVKEGAAAMVVRFDTAEAALQYASSGIYASARVLLGEESRSEWERAAAARGAGAAGRARGRDRLLARAGAAAGGGSPATARAHHAAMHIRFDD